LLLRALSRPPSAGAVDSPGRAAEDAPGAATGARLAEIRRLIREAAWDEAQEAVAAFRSDSPEDPRGAEVSDELEGAMRSALERLEAELEAARGVNDPEQAMVIYSRMQPLVDDRARGERDADLARWFLLVVHRRLRGGRIQPDVVGLADRVAEQFGHTKEGASLRAALPTLRRSAGLCPRCGKPFTGAADACPECLGAPPPSPLVEPEEDEDEEMRGDRREPDWYTEPSDESAA
jgi:rubrerythrin